MLITLTIINWLLRLLDVYSIILVIYALMSWIPTLYGTWFGRIIVKVSRPYLSLFENLPLIALCALIIIFGVWHVDSFYTLVNNGVNIMMGALK